MSTTHPFSTIISSERSAIRPIMRNPLIVVAMECLEMKKLIARLQERSGIYSLGFDPVSFLGIALPIGFVVVVGGAISAYIMFG